MSEGTQKFTIAKFFATKLHVLFSDIEPLIIFTAHPNLIMSSLS